MEGVAVSRQTYEALQGMEIGVEFTAHSMRAQLQLPDTKQMQGAVSGFLCRASKVDMIKRIGFRGRRAVYKLTDPTVVIATHAKPGCGAKVGRTVHRVQGPKQPQLDNNGIGAKLDRMWPSPPFNPPEPEPLLTVDDVHVKIREIATLLIALADDMKRGVIANMSTEDLAAELSRRFPKMPT